MLRTDRKASAAVSALTIVICAVNGASAGTRSQSFSPAPSNWTSRNINNSTADLLGVSGLQSNGGTIVSGQFTPGASPATNLASMAEIYYPAPAGTPFPQSVNDFLYHADTTVGTITPALSSFSVSGKFWTKNDAGAPQPGFANAALGTATNFRIGYFDATDTSSANPRAFGLIVNEAQFPDNGDYTMVVGAGRFTPPTAAFPTLEQRYTNGFHLGLTSNGGGAVLVNRRTVYDFTFSWDVFTRGLAYKLDIINLNSSGTIVERIPIVNASRTVTQAEFDTLAGVQYNAFGTLLPLDQLFNGNAQVRLDDLTYTVANPSWNVDASGNSTVGANWSPATSPNGAGAGALFGTVITANRTVTLTTPTVLGQVQFANTSASYTIAGSTNNQLTLNSGSAAPATLEVTAGSHAITAPVVLASPTAAKLLPGTRLELSRVTGTTSTPLSVQAGGVLAVKEYVGGPISVSDNSLVDLGTGFGIISGQSESSIRTLISSWYASGARNGSGIGTTLAQTSGNSPESFLTVGYIVNDSGGIAYYPSYRGLTAPLSSIIVAAAYTGDADLNGVVNAFDLNLFMTGLGSGLTGWRNGDFNYDNVIDNADAQLLLGALAANLPSLTLGSGGAGTTVPEPAALSLLALPALSLVRRRR